jgi:hypothetical protein
MTPEHELRLKIRTDYFAETSRFPPTWLARLYASVHQPDPPTWVFHAFILGVVLIVALAA